MKPPLFFLTTLTCAAGDWVNISDDVTSKVKPGYAGPTAGICVEPDSAGVYLVVNDQGLWLRGGGHPQFERIDNKNIGGRCETGWALQINPAGKGLACFMI